MCETAKTRYIDLPINRFIVIKHQTMQEDSTIYLIINQLTPSKTYFFESQC